MMADMYPYSNIAHSVRLSLSLEVLSYHKSELFTQNRIYVVVFLLPFTLIFLVFTRFVWLLRLLGNVWIVAIK